MRRLNSVILIIIKLINLTSEADGLLLDLFSEKDRHGLSIRLDVSDDECSNLPVSWTNRAKSINTFGSCVQLYDEPFCKGSLTVIQPFHIIHQMDISLINFANRIQSGSPCGPKIKTGRFVVQNAADATVLTVNSKYGGFARAHTTNASKVIPKFQQWEILDRGNSEYTLKPREFGDNYPVSFDEEALKKGQIKRKIWKLNSVGRGRYLIKNELTQTCLYKTESNKVEEHDCRSWSPNQEWVFRPIFGNPKQEKQNAAVGPGANFNILSKVAGYRPPTKAPPQFYPIYYNITTLAKIKRFSTAAPYIIRKKIKRGPRPKTKPFELINALRPPGLRPALSSKVANNNNYLLLRNPSNKKASGNKDSEFVPSDDRLETFTYYQFVQKAHRQALAAQAVAVEQQAILDKQKPKVIPKKKDDEESDESNEDDEDNSEDDEEKRPMKITKEPVGLPTSNKTETEESSGFLTNVYTKVKSRISSVTSMSFPLPALPALPSFRIKSEEKNVSTANEKEESKLFHIQPPPPYRKYKGHSSLYRRLSKKPSTKRTSTKSSILKSTTSSTTPKSTKSNRWSFFG